LLWAVLAAVRPGTTFHLAPLLVAGAVPWLQRVEDRPARLAAYRLAAVGIGIAVGTSVLLAIAGWLDGPTLLPFGGALEESLVGAIIGGLAGLAVVIGPRRMRAD
jgi:predicted aminopeptidase